MELFKKRKGLRNRSNSDFALKVKKYMLDTHVSKALEYTTTPSGATHNDPRWVEDNMKSKRIGVILERRKARKARKTK